jgi:anti-anti-sigma regulatory factor
LILRHGTTASVVVHLGAVTFMTSRFVTELLRANHFAHRQGRVLFLAAIGPHIRKTLETVGVLRVVQEVEEDNPGPVEAPGSAQFA